MSRLIGIAQYERSLDAYAQQDISVTDVENTQHRDGRRVALISAFFGLEAMIAAYDPMTEVEANQAALDAAGGWGVPTMVFRGEPSFGQDRIDTLRWRLEKSGVRKL